MYETQEVTHDGTPLTVTTFDGYTSVKVSFDGREAEVTVRTPQPAWYGTGTDPASLSWSSLGSVSAAAASAYAAAISYAAQVAATMNAAA